MIRAHELEHERFTSMETALISDVPFFTVDYWDRSRFLRPTVARGGGRGRGRERLYAYTDLMRLSIARRLRDEKISLETLRRVMRMLAPRAADLAGSRFVAVGQEVNVFTGTADLVAWLDRTGGQRTSALLLDLTEVQREVTERAQQAIAERERSQRPVVRREGRAASSRDPR